MKSYQKLFYKRYYAQNSEGEYAEVSKGECFAPGDEPTADNPYKQRWYYDVEAGYAVRLERSERGERVYRASDTALKREERAVSRKNRCVRAGDGSCDRDCGNCQNYAGRNFELDKPVTDGDGAESYFELPDSANDVAAVFEKKELLAALRAAIGECTPDERKLCAFILARTPKKAVAEYFGISVKGVEKREAKLREKIRADKALKSFFENF